MAVYKTMDLLKMLSELINEGYEYVDISEEDSDDEDPVSLYFEGIEDAYSNVDFDSVYSCELPEDYDGDSWEINQNDPFPHMFTYNEIFTIDQALSNALQYYKEISQDKSCPRDTRDSIKRASVDCRNLEAKLAKIFKSLGL